jgi:hypothetical protein
MNGLDPAISIKYMLAGYAVVLIVIPIYLTSLIIRWSALKRKLRDLDEVKVNKN